MLMEMCMWENGKMTRQKDRGYTCTWMELGMKDSGERISNMVRVLRVGLMVLGIKGFMMMV
jgi:hypothetical protein